MSAPDPLAEAIKAALADELAAVGTPPSGGAGDAVRRGRHLRHVRRVRTVAVAVAAALVAAAVLGGALLLVRQPSDDGSAPATGVPTPGAPGGPEASPAPTTPVPSTQVPPSSSTTSSTTSTTGPPAEVRPSAPPAVPPAVPVPPSTPPSTAAPPTTTTTVPPTPALELLVSTSADRSGAQPLDGAVLSGVVHVFYDHVAFPLTGPDVTFWIDDPSAAGPAHRVESSAPYDLEATAPGGTAYGFDTGTLAPGVHTVTASAGPGHLVTATFTVT